MRSFTCCLTTVLFLLGAPAEGFGAAPQTPASVQAQDLQQLRVPGKIASVVWTRRNDVYTLQLVLQMPTEYQLASKMAVQRAAQGLAPAPPATPNLPQVQAWLLKLDGTLIARSPGSPAFPAAAKASDGVPLEVRYSFAQSAAQEAVAVAIMVDGTYYIEQLKPFE